MDTPLMALNALFATGGKINDLEYLHLVALLENVKGFRRVIDQVLEIMDKNLPGPKKTFKWKDQHAEWAKKHKVKGAKGYFKQNFPEAAKQILSPREVDALDKVLKFHNGEIQAANTSQTIGRMSLVLDKPKVPLMPNATILLVKEQQFLTGQAAHSGSPCHVLNAQELLKMTGNGMSMRALYAAMIVGLMALNPFKVRKYMRLNRATLLCVPGLMKTFEKSLPSNIDLSERAPRAWRSDPQTDIGRKDVFCLVKAEMSDMKLSQDPLLVWPGVLQRQSDQLLQVANSTTLLDKPSLDDERRNDVKRLIEAMKRDYPDMRRAINWYQSVLDRDANHSEAYTTLTFLRNVPDDGPSVHDFRFGPVAGKPHISVIPNASVDDFYLSLAHFDYSPGAKNGFYPSNCQFQAHFGEFLTYGYKPTESVSVKFHNDRGDRVLGRFETGFVDGQTKCLLMLSIVAFCAELNFSELELQNANLQKATGRTMDSFVAAHQDKSKNALSKALEASFVAWVEELKADQAQFSSEKDCHTRSWDIVSGFMKEYLTLFVGKSAEAESTVMPASRAWLREMCSEHGNHFDDHAVFLWCNCPSIGVMSATRVSFILNFISNVLADFPMNSVCVLVHPNRASQQEGRKPGAKKEEDEDEPMEKNMTGDAKEDDDSEESDDICNGKTSVCGSLCLDHSGSDLLSRVSNRVYENCRSGAMSLPGFPNFEPIISGLKSNQPVDRQKSFRVSVQQMDRLVILQSLAQKWVDTESTRERALEIIADHNNQFNADGSYWMEERKDTSDESSKVEEPPRKRVKLETFSEQDISKLGHVSLG
ncbi:Uncharacterized protein SCF082_LOCUS16566 [Durusdinium trenchii]|uniref:Uncharacterized protein n=1 Tax=Durusdinium trenchii TaxID=1381693 RepID=A0ABP0KBX5_9DINO